MNKYLLCGYTWYILNAVNAVSFDYSASEEWNLFKTKFSKSYSSEIEEDFRFKVFMENKRLINRHNERFRIGEVTFEMGINDFSDLLHYEVVNMTKGRMSNLRRGKNGYKDGNVTYYKAPPNFTAPRSMDWRTKGAVTAVKHQGGCGSCWAFSAVGGLEGQHFIKTGELVPLSVQNLIDCSSSYGNKGCNGGYKEEAFRYVIDNGIATAKAYPYEAKKRKCKYKRKYAAVTADHYVEIPSGDEKALKLAVATVGPIPVAIDTGHTSFENYGRGIYYEPRCSSSSLGHEALVVGYGTEKGHDYWLVKNSWGRNWGMDGYVKMTRNKRNNCGIASEASYPLV